MTKPTNSVITVLFACYVLSAQGLPLQTPGLTRIVKKTGSDVRIPCPLSNSEPVHLFRWYKDEVEIDDSFERFEVGTQSLRIYGSTVEDSGHYKCQGSDGFGRTKQLEFEVIIVDPNQDEEGKTTTNITGEKTSLQQSRIVKKTGSDVRIPCPLSSDGPAYLFRWYKDDVEIDDTFTRYYDIYRYEVGNEVGTHSLRIRGATVADSGQYECQATSGLGKTKQLQFSVIIVDPSEGEQGKLTMDKTDGTTEPLEKNSSSSVDSRFYPMALIISLTVLCVITIPILVVVVVGKRRHDKRRRYAAAETTAT